jgi:hypothetical protein
LEKKKLKNAKGGLFLSFLLPVLIAKHGKLHRNIAIFSDGDWFFDRIQLAEECHKVIPSGKVSCTHG